LRETRFRLTLAVIGVIAASACIVDPFTGSIVVADFLSDLEPNVVVRLPDGSTSHYEMWADFEGYGVISLGSFVVNSDGHIQSYPDIENRIGSVTGADDLRRSGVRWVTESDLSDATGVFVSLEPDGETDISPSGVVIMQGALDDGSEGAIRATMTGQYETRLGEIKSPVATVAIIIAEDNI
jgi:hypothetical protein